MAIGTLVVPTDRLLSVAGKLVKTVPRATPSAIAPKIHRVR